MPKYEVELVGTFYDIFTTEADNEEDAVTNAKEMFWDSLVRDVENIQVTDVNIY